MRLVPSVSYAISITWPSEEQSVICQRELPLADAAERLEVLAEELREAVKASGIESLGVGVAYGGPKL